MNIKYQNKLVAFIDVLGFSNLVYSNKMEEINSYYEMLLTGFREVARRKRLDFLLISDSIVVYAPLKKQNLATFVSVLYGLQYKLLLKGILIRGGISYGNLYTSKKDNIVVGTGLINAYKLESQAIYPRIIIDRRLVGLFFDGSDNFNNELGIKIKMTSSPIYIKDFPYINYARAVSLDIQPIHFQCII